MQQKWPCKPRNRNRKWLVIPKAVHIGILYKTYNPQTNLHHKVTCPTYSQIYSNHQIQAKEPRSFPACGRPRVGVGGLCTFNSCQYQVEPYCQAIQPLLETSKATIDQTHTLSYVPPSVRLGAWHAHCTWNMDFKNTQLETARSHHSKKKNKKQNIT